MGQKDVKINIHAEVQGFAANMAQAQAHLERLARAFPQYGAAAESAANKTTKLETTLFSLKNAITTVATGFGLFKTGEYIKDATLLNARYETLGIVLGVVGRNAGYSAAQMEAHAESVRKMGITLIESRQTVISMAQAQIDLSKASGLARVAQDAAVIANVNSSEALNRMVYGIKSAQVETLRTLGINVSFEASYERLAAQLNKNKEALTEAEKAQARTNEVLEAGTLIAGSYEAAMTTAGKQLNSMQRYMEDLQVAIGETFNEMLVIAVEVATGKLKELNEDAKKLAQEDQLREWGRNVTNVFAVVADAALIVKGAFVELGRDIAVFFKTVELVGKYSSIAGIFANRREIAKDIQEYRAFTAARVADNVEWQNSIGRVQRAMEERFATMDKEIAGGRALSAVMKEYGGDAKRAGDAVAKIDALFFSGAISDGKHAQAVADLTGKYSAQTSALTSNTAAAGANKNAKKEQIDKVAQTIAALEFELAQLGRSAEGQAFYNALKRAGITENSKFAGTIKNLVAAVEKEKAVQKTLNNELEAAIKLQDDMVAAYDKKDETARNATKTLEDELAKLKESNATFGLGKAAIADLTVAKYEHAVATAKMTDANSDATKELEKQLNTAKELAIEYRRRDGLEAAKDKAKELADAYNKTSEDINRSLTDALMRGFESGKGFAKNFRDTVKNLFNTLILRPVISAIMQPVAQGITGLLGMGMSGAANASGGGIGGGLVGTGLQMAGSALGLGTAGASIAAGFAAAEGAGLATGMAMAGDMMAMGGIMEGIGAGLAAIGPAGWIALAALAVWAIFSKDGGGPKTGGSFISSFQGMIGKKSELERLYTPNQSDEMIRPAVEDINSVYQSLINRMGSNRTDVTFGLGFDSDPQGTAPNRVSATVSAGGQNLLNILNRSLGRDEKDLDAGMKQAMAEMLQAALVPAFKDIGKAFGDLMKGFTGNLEEVTSYAMALITLNEALVKGGAAFDKLKESLGGFGQMSLQMATDLAHIVAYAVADPIKAATDIAQQQSRGLLDNWNAQGSAIRELLKTYDGSITATQQLSAATQARYQTELQLVQQIGQALLSVSALFKGSAESIRFGVLDTAGKDQFLFDKISNLETLLLSASDPAVIQTISQDLNTAVMARFNLLDPAQQSGRAEEFAGFLEYLDQQAQARLNLTLAGVTNEHDPNNPQSLATLINSALTDAAAKLAAAALAQQTAANTQLQAANTPLAVNVDVNVDVENNTANTEVAIA